MDYAYYNNEPQPTFHQPPFNGFPNTHSDFSPGINSHHPQQIYPNNNGYPPLDPAYQFNGNASFIPPQPQQQPSPPLNSDSSESVPQANSLHGGNGIVSGEHNGDLQEQDGNRSSSEDKDNFTPAQSRRKAQNRAAQRAFRERKERHVKDLEDKLHSLSAHSTTLLTDNERLKRELQRLATQNEILRATSTSQPSSGPRPPSPIHGPQIFSPIAFQAAVGEGHHPISYEDYGGPVGQRLLAIGATWDFIMNHEAYKKGLVDIVSVHQKLKGHAKCNGRGPAFQEQDVLRAIQQSIGTSDGSDELL